RRALRRQRQRHRGARGAQGGLPAGGDRRGALEAHGSSRPLARALPPAARVLAIDPHPAQVRSRRGGGSGRLLQRAGGAGGVAEAVEILAPQIGPRLQLLHQTGVKDREEIAARYQKLAAATGLQAEAMAFIDDMPRAYGAADVLVCRAGATTIAELTVCKKPAILVPFPFAADDHQTVNAHSLVDAGAAIVIAEKDLTAQRLADEIKVLESDR